MLDVMKRIKILGLLLLMVVWLTSSISTEAGSWPNKEFKVYKENPDPISANDVSAAKLKYDTSKLLGVGDEKNLKKVYENVLRAWLHTVSIQAKSRDIYLL